MGSDQQFILRWHFQESTLLNGLPKLLENELLTDITLSVGCKKIKAHKIILATCSTYFLQLFQDMDSLQHPVIILQDTDFNDLNAIISFIYRGQCLVTEKQLPSVIAAAKLLQIRGLCDFKIPETKPQSIENTKDFALVNVPLPINIKNDSTNNNESIVIKPDSNIRDEVIYNNNNNLTTMAICDKIETINTEPEIVVPLDTTVPLGAGPQNARAVCPICGKALSNQYNLRVHLETHRGARHACPTCAHVSRSRDALRKHVAYRHPGFQTGATQGRKRRGLGDI